MSSNFLCIPMIAFFIFACKPRQQSSEGKDLFYNHPQTGYSYLVYPQKDKGKTTNRVVIVNCGKAALPEECKAEKGNYIVLSKDAFIQQLKPIYKMVTKADLNSKDEKNARTILVAQEELARRLARLRKLAELTGSQAVEQEIAGVLAQMEKEGVKIQENADIVIQVNKFDQMIDSLFSKWIESGKIMPLKASDDLTLTAVLAGFFDKNYNRGRARFYCRARWQIEIDTFGYNEKAYEGTTYLEVSGQPTSEGRMSRGWLDDKHVCSIQNGSWWKTGDLISPVGDPRMIGISCKTWRETLILEGKNNLEECSDYADCRCDLAGEFPPDFDFDKRPSVVQLPAPDQRS